MNQLQTFLRCCVTVLDPSQDLTMGPNSCFMTHLLSCWAFGSHEWLVTSMSPRPRGKKIGSNKSGLYLTWTAGPCTNCFNPVWVQARFKTVSVHQKSSDWNLTLCQPRVGIWLSHSKETPHNYLRNLKFGINLRCALIGENIKPGTLKVSWFNWGWIYSNTCKTVSSAVLSWRELVATASNWGMQPRWRTGELQLEGKQNQQCTCDNTMLAILE